MNGTISLLPLLSIYETHFKESLFMQVNYDLFILLVHFYSLVYTYTSLILLICKLLPPNFLLQIIHMIHKILCTLINLSSPKKIMRSTIPFSLSLKKIWKGDFPVDLWMMELKANIACAKTKSHGLGL